MLTRIEIDGFKSYVGTGLDLPPFMVVLGPNASGKSNLFDAIRFLSRVAELDLRSAIVGDTKRGWDGLRGEPHELFHRDAEGAPGERMNFAVEVLLAPEITDPWGATQQLTQTRLRYELGIERRREKGLERLVIVHEAVKPISSKSDRWTRQVQPSKEFSRQHLKYGRKVPFLDTIDVDDRPTFEIHQDGHQGRKRSAVAAEATVLSSVTSAEFPHLFALREELRSWRFLQLDPGTLRRPSPTVGPRELLEPDGSNLASVLARIAAETSTDVSVDGVLSDISADLSALVPGVLSIRVEEDAAARRHKLFVRMRDGQEYASELVSDGTLRVLALLTMLHDPNFRGFICFEEPENGIHPMRLKALIRRLQELVTDPRRDHDGPLAQILMNSHSPVVLSALDSSQMVFADVVSVVGGGQRPVPRTRLRAVARKDQGDLLQAGEAVSTFEVDRYLQTVEGAA